MAKPGTSRSTPVSERNSRPGSVLGSIFTFPSVSTGLSVAFVAYIVYALWGIYKIYYPSPCPLTEQCIKPSWKERTRFQMSAFVSKSHRERDLKHIWSADNVDISEPFQVELNITLPAGTRRNGTLFLHFYLCPTSGSGQLTSSSQFSPEKTSKKVSPLTKYLVQRTEAVNLLGDQTATTERQNRGHEGGSPTSSDRPVTHWIPRMSVHVMSEPRRLHGLPQEMFPYFSFNTRNEYLPIIHIDHFGVLEKDFLPVNSSVEVMPLKLSYVPVSFGKMRLIIVVEQSLKMFERAGFSDKESDDMKAIFFDTNIYLLFLTFLVSGFHLLFDVLAFKNDISFWRRRKSIVGLSFRSLIWRCISQTIVFVYLYDQGTSYLVLVPSGIAIIIEFWKVTKALKLNIYWDKWRPRFELGTVTEAEKQSDAYDSQGMKYLMWLVAPCCLIYAIYSLLYVKHTSWFSWCLESVVNGVYAFGFIFMLPQLFVNYKLKSVAHLPWKVFMYKAFNTVVDDLFAFIISMPTAHRIACFRDDIVFVVYLYQRWLYPVDKNRITEYDDSSGDIQEKAKKE